MRSSIGLWCSCLAIGFGAASIAAPSAEIPDSISARDVPPVPQRLADELNRYQNIRLAAFEDWNPGGPGVLILTRFANTNQVHRVETPLGAREQLTFLRDRVTAARSRPGRAQFLFSSDEGGGENFQLSLFDSETGAAHLVTDGRSRNVDPRWSRSGRLLAWSSNARNGKDMDLYVADPSSPRSARRLREVNGEWLALDWSPDDRRILAGEFVSINESYLHLIDVDSGRIETITPRAAAGAPTVAYFGARWSPDGRFLYWTSDAGSEFHRLVRYELSSRRATPLTDAIPWDVDGFDLSDDGALIAFVVNEEGYSRVHRLDTATGRDESIPEIPAGEISGLRFRRGSPEFAFTVSGPRTPSDVYSFDLASRKLARWTRSETGGLDPSRFSEPTLVHYPTFDGRQIPAFVYRPPQSFPAPHPVLINIHGGPESQFRPGFQGRNNYYVTDAGVAMIFPNVRGSAGYGKTYLKLDNGMRREDTIKDIGALLDWIRGEPDLDASRILVMGGSYGGYMTLATMTHYSDRLRGGMDTVGISNFLTFLKNTQDYRRDLRRVEYGDERVPDMREFLSRISPLSSANRIRRPLLVAAGQNDPRVPVTESEQIVEEVRKNGVPVWYVVGKNEGHGFQKKVNQDYLQSVQVLFVKRFLLGEPAAER